MDSSKYKQNLTASAVVKDVVKDEWGEVKRRSTNLWIWRIWRDSVWRNGLWSQVRCSPKSSSITGV